MSAIGTPACGRCGAGVTPGSRYCPSCGADVSGPQSDVATAFIPGVEASRPGRGQAALLEVLRAATLGDYEILGELGRGGMATVYLAHDIALDRKVAIKVISPTLLEGEGMVERFKREARTAAALSHPHIIPIFAVKVSEQILYFVMKFVQGRPLDSIIREVGPLPIPMVQAIFAQVGGALGYAHRRGIVHRDVKPANIMLDDEGWAVVTDFGIAKITEAQGLTVTGVTVGTPAYMSPEQCSAKPVTGGSDQYSLAVVTYEMLTGRPPFSGDSVMALMYAQFNEQPRPIRELRTECPPALEAAVMRMLEKAPEKRWPHIEDAIAGVGGHALAHDDPVRTGMIELARSRMSIPALQHQTPTSPIPPAKRPSAAVVAIAVSPAASRLEAGATLQLAAALSGAKGETLTDRPVAWASSAPLVVTVSARGLVTALGAGSAMITATSEGVSGTAAVTVTPAAVASVAVTPPAPSVSAGETVRLTATPRDGRGNALAGRPVTWQSASSTVASVSKDGLVTARAVGTTAVTASCEGQRGSAEVTVTPVPVAEVRVTPAEVRLPVGDTAQLRATTMDAHGSVLAGRLVAWKSSDATVTAVSAGGLVTAVAPGAVKISATSEGRSASATVLVTAASTAETAAERTAAAPPVPARPRARPTWRSSTLGVAVAVVIVAAGVWLLGPWRTRDAPTAATEPPAPTTPRPVAALTVTPAAQTLEAGGTLQLTATLRDASGRTLGDRAVSWTSSAPAVASVSAAGLVTAGDAGSAVITATSETRSTRVTLTVVAARAPAPAAAPAGARVASLTLGPTDGRVPAGGTLQLNATARDRGGRALPGRSVSWTSSHPRAATVSVGGLVTGVAPGSARITATSEGTRAVATVTVTPPPPPPPATPAPVAAVVITPASRSLQRGETLQLSASLRDAAGAVLSGRAIRWTSSNPAVATVSAEGVVTAVAGGTASISATSEERTGTADVTITPPPAAPADTRADRAAAEAGINAALAEFARALESRRIAEVRRVYPGMTAQQDQQWRELLESRDVTQLTAKISRTTAPTISGNAAEVAFALALSFRTPSGGRAVQDVTYRATLTREASSWRLGSLVTQPR